MAKLPHVNGGSSKRPRSLLFVLVVAAALLVASIPSGLFPVTGTAATRAQAQPATTAARRSVKAKAPTGNVVPTKKKSSTAKTVKKTAKPKVRTTTTTRPRARATTTTRPIAIPTTAAATPVQTQVPTTIPIVVAAESIPPSTSDVIAPLPGNTTIPPVSAAVATTTSSTTTTTTTRLPPAPYPAGANLPSRATAATLEPYRGLGVWIDRLDWTVRFSGKQVPAVSAATMDQIAAAGVQTVYIQAAHWSTTPDVLEPERLLPMIDRAHALGMNVVLWYLPYLQDVNTDLRKMVALANLDIDGIQVDIEEKDLLRDVNIRNQRLLDFGRSVRTLLPGRIISADIVSPVWMDPAPDRWPPHPGQRPRVVNSYWRGAFPYAEIASQYDLLAIQAYWTENSSLSGWRDSLAFTTESVNRLRAAINRPGYPIHVIGGIPNKATRNDLAGMVAGIRAIGGSYGVSLYDWVTTPNDWWPALWSFRTQPDPRFTPIELPPFVPPTQPPPTTTTTTTTTLPTVIGPPPTLPPPTPSTAPSTTSSPGSPGSPGSLPGTTIVS